MPLMAFLTACTPTMDIEIWTPMFSGIFPRFFPIRSAWSAAPDIFAAASFAHPKPGTFPSADKNDANPLVREANPFKMN